MTKLLDDLLIESDDDNIVLITVRLEYKTHTVLDNYCQHEMINNIPINVILLHKHGEKINKFVKLGIYEGVKYLISRNTLPRSLLNELILTITYKLKPKSFSKNYQLDARKVTVNIVRSIIDEYSSLE